MRNICILPLRAFVDPEYLLWLKQTLPRRLRADLETLYGSNLEKIPWDTPVCEIFGNGAEPRRFDTWLTDALISTHDARLAFHGMPHGQRVCCDGDDALEIMQLYLGPLPRELYQVIILALAMHDKGHVGAAFFATADADRIPNDPEVNPQHTTLEFYTAKLVDKMLQEHMECYSPLARLIANYTVISSAFGAMHPQHGPRLQLQNVKPKALCGTLMRCADVVPPADFVAGINAEAALMYLERPAMPPEPSWHAYIESRVGFLQYVGFTMDQLDATMMRWMPAHWQDDPASLTTMLGWRSNLKLSMLNLGKMREGGVKSAALRSTLGVLRVPLD